MSFVKLGETVRLYIAHAGYKHFVGTEQSTVRTSIHWTNRPAYSDNTMQQDLREFIGKARFGVFKILNTN